MGKHKNLTTFGNFLSPISYVAVGVYTFPTVLVRWQVQRGHKYWKQGAPKRRDYWPMAGLMGV